MSTETSNMTPDMQTYLDKVSAERGRRAAVQTRYFLKELPSDLSPKSLDALRTSLKASPLSPSSVNRKLNAIRAYLIWLSSTERANLSKRAIRDNLGFYRERRKKVTLPPRHAVKKLLRLAIRRPGRHGMAYCSFMALGLFAGLRPGEIEAANTTDIPEGKQYIHVKHTKTDIERHAYFRHSTVLAIALPRLTEFDGPIVSSGAKDWFPLAAAEAGMGRVGRNVLRKLHASYMAASGKFSEYDLMQHLGHTSATSIKFYRDPEVMDSIQPGDSIEEWMGVSDLNDALIDRILGHDPRYTKPTYTASAKPA